MVWALMAAASAATPIAGLEWAPLSRDDLVWVDSGRTTDSAVGEFDGIVWPDLRPFAGAWFGRYVGWTGSLGVARITVTTAAADVVRSRHRGVVRPSTDLRFGLLEPTDLRPRPFLLVGGHVSIPSARETGDGLSPQELAIADADAALERALLGGAGGRVGLGVDVPVSKYLRLGLLWSSRLHTSWSRPADGTSVTTWVASEGALTLMFEWPSRDWGEEPASDHAVDGARIDPLRGSGSEVVMPVTTR
jgi:hypothetical protein